MATRLSVSLPKIEVTFSGITVERKCDGALHGRIRIRQNYIDWLPAGHQKVYRLKWKEFAAYAEDRNRKKETANDFCESESSLCVT